MGCLMVAHGRVQNGVIVLDGSIRLPEGEEVTVLLPRRILSAAPEDGLPLHSVLDVPAVSVGAVLRPLTSDDDLLGEMLEGRS